MQTESLKADPPKRKRRCFQFRLRTMLVGVTALAVAAGLWKALGPPIIIQWFKTYDGRERLDVMPNMVTLTGLFD
jgi:hypothetical protein